MDKHVEQDDERQSRCHRGEIQSSVPKEYVCLGFLGFEISYWCGI